MSDKMREDFEVYAASKGWEPHQMKRRADGGYEDWGVHPIWVAFQACGASRVAEIAHLKAENEALRKMLVDASEEIADWGAYASEYFQEKHNLAGCVAKFHDAAMGKAVQP